MSGQLRAMPLTGDGPTGAFLPGRPSMGSAAVGVGSEAHLVEALRRGDQDAYELLVRTHASRLLAVARRILRCEDDARDALQEAFLAAFKAIDRFESGSSLSTWLHRIVINAALMKLRSSGRRPEAPIEDLLPQFDETGHRLGVTRDWSESAEHALLRAETGERVRAAIETLPDSYRVVLMLRDIEELSTEEAAQSLGITTTAVKVRLHRARQALRTRLEPMFAVKTAVPPRA